MLVAIWLTIDDGAHGCVEFWSCVACETSVRLESIALTSAITSQPVPGHDVVHCVDEASGVCTSPAAELVMHATWLRAMPDVERRTVPARCRLTNRWSGRVRDKVPSSYTGARAAQLNR